MAAIETSQRHYRFGATVGLDQAEAIVRDLGVTSPPSSVFLDFSGCPRFVPGTSFRLGNALRRLQGHDIVVSVDEPKLGEESRLFSRRQWYLSFTRSCLGYSLAAYAKSCTCNGRDITSSLREYYDALRERPGNSTSFAITGLTDASQLEVDDASHFEKTLIQALRLMNVSINGLGQQAFESISRMLFEAIQNVYDHAAKRPLGRGQRICSSLSIAYYKLLDANYADESRSWLQYVANLKQEGIDASNTAFLHFVVNDDGAGIAARQSQDADIYYGSLDSEREATYLAFKHNQSVKLKTTDCRIRGTPGAGFTFIADGIRAARGLSRIRTGRLLAVLDCARHADVAEFAIYDRPLGYMPGTNLDILVPILDRSGQGWLY